jgi:hypothetical protein
MFYKELFSKPSFPTACHRFQAQVIHSDQSRHQAILQCNGRWLVHFNDVSFAPVLNRSKQKFHFYNVLQARLWGAPSNDCYLTSLTFTVKIKVFIYTLCRHASEWRCSSNDYYCYQMRVSGQRHPPAALSPFKEDPTPIEFPEPIWMLLRRESLLSNEIKSRFLTHLSRSPVAK